MWKRLYMYLCKLDFIVVKCGRKLKFHYSVQWKSLISNFSTICGAAYATYGKVHSRLYANWGSLIHFLICKMGSGIKVHPTMRPFNGLLCQPRVIMIMVKSVECLAGETELLGENLPSAALSITNPTCSPYVNPGRRGRKPTSIHWATARPQLGFITNQHD
jgi:hypothetical protein